jgi:GrxC family glutaredoxin
MTKPVIVYSSMRCPYCEQAKKLLDAKGVSYEVIRVDQDPRLFEEMLSKSNGLRTVPQIFIDNHHIGGFDALYALEQVGDLDLLLGR